MSEGGICMLGTVKKPWQPEGSGKEWMYLGLTKVRALCSGGRPDRVGGGGGGGG